MIRQGLWATLVVALMALVSAAQLDRAARHDGELAHLVPAPFRGFAAWHLALDAVAAGDARLAQQRAVALLEARPLPSEHLSVLAQARAMAGDGAGALQALEAASARGWRDPLAQLAAAEAALAAGDHAAAAQRIAALHATGALPEEREALLRRLLRDTEGRRAFAAQLSQAGRWHGAAIPVAARLLLPADLAAVLREAQQAGAPLPCDRLETAAAALDREGFAGEAARFWPGPCRS